MKLGVKVIHCSERDTQITDRPKQVDEFVNTWSIEGFREEGITTAEMGWGTHEKQFPPLTYQHSDGPRNQICLARMGINTWVVSWVPYYCIRGMIIRHGEAFTISDRLTVWDDGVPVYRPTVHYAYCPCDAALVSLEELRGRDYDLQPSQRILSDEIVGGADILGALLMGHAYGAWWTGSVLEIEESRRWSPARTPPPCRWRFPWWRPCGGWSRTRTGASACPTICPTTTCWESPGRTSASRSRSRPTGRR